MSMRRLIIPSAAKDGREELSFTAEELEMEKAMAFKASAGCARSRGGRDIEVLLLEVS